MVEIQFLVIIVLLFDGNKFNWSLLFYRELQFIVTVLLWILIYCYCFIVNFNSLLMFHHECQFIVIVLSWISFFC